MNRSGLPPSGGPSTSSGLIGGSGMGSSHTPQHSMLSTVPSAGNPPEGRNHVTKVAEVFLTAGHAFQRLGDLTLQLQGAKGEAQESEESKWMDSDISNLRDALTRFAHELDTISESVQQRTMKHIKVDIKRRTLVGDDTVRRQSPAVTGMGMGMGGPMGLQKRGHLMMPQSGLTTKRMGSTQYSTKFQPYPNTMAASRLSAATRPPTSYLTESSVTGGSPSLSTPLSTPLLNEPSHHYISSRPGNNY